jgi:hypothetical protein
MIALREGKGYNSVCRSSEKSWNVSLIRENRPPVARSLVMPGDRTRVIRSVCVLVVSLLVVGFLTLTAPRVTPPGGLGGFDFLLMCGLPIGAFVAGKRWYSLSHRGSDATGTTTCQEGTFGGWRFARQAATRRPTDNARISAQTSRPIEGEDHG